MIEPKTIIIILLIILVIIIATVLFTLRKAPGSYAVIVEADPESKVGGKPSHCLHEGCVHDLNVLDPSKTFGSCEECKKGGCPFCGRDDIDAAYTGSDDTVHLSSQGKKVIAASVRVDADRIQGSAEESKSNLAQAVKESDQNKVAEYLSKAAHEEDDKTALELRALKSDIINVIGAYPGLVEFTQNIQPTSSNDNVVGALEDIQTAVRGKVGGCDACGGDDSTNNVGGTISGGSRGGTHDENIERVTEEIYGLMKPYIREIGSSRNVENYLKRTGKVSVTAKNVSEDIKRDKSIKHNILYQIIHDIIDKNWDIKNKEDFIEKMALRYEHFLPIAKRKWLSMADELNIDIVPDLRNELRVYMRDVEKSSLYSRPGKTFSRSDLDKVLDKIEGSMSIFKFAPGYAKKTKSVIAKAKGKAYEVDTLAVLPLLKATAVSLYDASKWTDAVNLIRELGVYKLRSPEEEAVRRILLSISEDISDETERQRVKRILIDELERERRLRDLEAKERERLERLEREREEERRRIMATIPAFSPEAVGPPSRPPPPPPGPPPFGPPPSAPPAEEPDIPDIPDVPDAPPRILTPPPTAPPPEEEEEEEEEELRYPELRGLDIIGSDDEFSDDSSEYSDSSEKSIEGSDNMNMHIDEMY